MKAAKAQSIITNTADTAPITKLDKTNNHFDLGWREFHLERCHAPFSSPCSSW